jgi:hypothetical protein
MPARGNPSALALGPGYLYIGAMGRVEPTDLVTAWATVDAGWVLLGYTDAGSEFDYNLSVDPVDVAEELDPISNQTTGRVASLKFAASQMTVTNLKLALNGGVVSTAAGVVTFEPPDLGTEVRTMIGWESEDHTERWVYRQCFQTGTLAITRAKGAANATLPVEFTLEKPATGARLFKAMLASPQRA